MTRSLAVFPGVGSGVLTVTERLDGAGIKFHIAGPHHHFTISDGEAIMAPHEVPGLVVYIKD